MDGWMVEMNGTYTSIHSNSSRLRCLLRKAAARFFTRRASRLLKPETSGGMKSLLWIRSPTERFLLAPETGLAERLEPQEAVSATNELVCAAREAEPNEGQGNWSSGMSKTWWVGRQSSAAPSGDMDILSILEVGTGDADEKDPSESGGEEGR